MQFISRLLLSVGSFTILQQGLAQTVAESSSSYSDSGPNDIDVSVVEDPHSTTESSHTTSKEVTRFSKKPSPPVKRLRCESLNSMPGRLGYSLWCQIRCQIRDNRELPSFFPSVDQFRHKYEKEGLGDCLQTHTWSSPLEKEDASNVGHYSLAEGVHDAIFPLHIIVRDLLALDGAITMSGVSVGTRWALVDKFDFADPREQHNRIHKSWHGQHAPHHHLLETAYEVVAAEGVVSEDSFLLIRGITIKALEGRSSSYLIVFAAPDAASGVISIANSVVQPSPEEAALCVGYRAKKLSPAEQKQADDGATLSQFIDSTSYRCVKHVSSKKITVSENCPLSVFKFRGESIAPGSHEGNLIDAAVEQGRYSCGITRERADLAGPDLIGFFGRRPSTENRGSGDDERFSASTLLIPGLIAVIIIMATVM